MRFALIGAAGYIAPRHMKAIKDTGNELVAAIDPHDSAGVLDKFFPDCKFFTEIERFDRYLELLKRQDKGIDYISICSPNYLHDAHVRLALRAGSNAICEKPLVINPWNLDALATLEQEAKKNVYTIFQLRLIPEVIQLKKKLEVELNLCHNVQLTYVTRRGPWYQTSWKGNEEKSGGIAMNIGIHFFDLLIWLFGKVKQVEVLQRFPDKMVGLLHLERADVKWILSSNKNDLPKGCENAHRVLSVDGQEIDLSSQFTDLHTQVYKGILEGRGYKIKDARPSIQLVHDIRSKEN